jgi:ferredoxin-NADP reductase
LEPTIGNPARAPIGAIAGLAGLAGLADRFAWPLRVSHYLELVNPRWSHHALHARVDDLRDETRDTRTLTLRPGRGWRRHRAGQHVRVGVPIAGTVYRRTYSISSAPERADGCIEITVKAVADGRVSRHLVREIQRGTHLLLGMPQGDFVLPEAAPVRALFVSAGSGVTPLASMVRSLASRGDLPDIVHLHYARTVRDAIFGSELAGLASEHPRYRLNIVTTRAPGATEMNGHFGDAQLNVLCPDWKQRSTYACGPQGLLEDMEAQWREAGCAQRLHVERFLAPLAQAPADAAGGCVRFARSNREIATDGRTSLLRVAEDAGLRPPHGCRMGICHSCAVTLRAGRVRDLRTNALTDEPGARVQICICSADGDVELEA